MADTARIGGNRWRIAGWSAAAALLIAPLIAMQFTDEVRWDATDFIFAAVLIGCVGIGLELAMRWGRNGLYKAGAAVALGTAFLMTWINAAVSIIGGDGSPAGPLFLAVPVVAVACAAIARLKAAGMVRAMIATAVAQVAVPVIAQLAGLGVSGLEDMAKVVVLTVGFAGMWLAAGWLFRRGV